MQAKEGWMASQRSPNPKYEGRVLLHTCLPSGREWKVG